MKVWLVNPKTGKLKHAPAAPEWVGRQITLSLTTVILLAIVIIALWAFSSRAPSGLNLLMAALVIPSTVIRIFIIRRSHGRSMYLRGWRFADPRSVDAKWAAEKWGFSQLHIVPQTSPVDGFSLDEAAFQTDIVAAPVKPPLRVTTDVLPSHITIGSTMKVVLHNPNTGEMKVIKVGWSWTLLFFSSLLGLPLFMRRLFGWGLIFVTLYLIDVSLEFLVEYPSDGAKNAAQAINFIVGLGLNIFIAAKGNGYTARNLLSKGWRFAQPDAVDAQYAKRRWGVSDLPL